MNRVVFCILACILLLSTGNVFGQSLSLDHVTGLHGPDTVLVNQDITFYIRVTSDADSHAGITNGFNVYSPEGATWTTLVGDTLQLGWDQLFDLTFAINHNSITGSGADTVGFGGAKIVGPGLPANFDEVSYTITVGPIDPQYHKDHICLDSAFYPPTGTWKWAGPVVYPAWDGPHCFVIFDPNAPAEPSNIVLSPDSLYFTSVEGGPAPPSQTFDVLTDQDPFDFTLNESTPWIILSPILGTAPQTIDVNINNFGLTAGTYIDSVEVVAGTTDNSPQWMKVVLDVAPPPPTINVSETSFYFNAVAGGANPADKYFTISNVGGGDLNWSVTNNESWLSLSPASGTNTGEVTVSVDITGLGYADYVDTIVVSDPAATNDPVKIPVFLSVGSDLPLIAVADSFNFVIVETGSTTIPDGEIYIYNSGAGTMNFTLTENSPRLFTLTPSSGTAPQTVTIGYKISGGSAGDDYFDTLWVNSAEALNSPYPVVFQFHYVDKAAEIVLSSDTVQLNVFACSQGENGLLPQVYFTITNVSGGEPYNYSLQYESDLFWIETEYDTIPEFVSVHANATDLPLGTYYDTIWVYAANAINSPQHVIVKYNVIDGLQDPEILLSNSNYIIPTKENEGPIPGAIIHINNRYGGCMPWYIDNSVPWIYPDIDTGNVPGVMGFNVHASGFTLGEYPDSFYVFAPGATNSPQKVHVKLRVWKFVGDFNYDGLLNIADIVAMVDYFFLSGPGPQPEWRVADLNCDHSVNVADLVYFVDYAFQNGPIPCGNPYK